MLVILDFTAGNQPLSRHSRATIQHLLRFSILNSQLSIITHTSVVDSANTCRAAAAYHIS